MIEPTVDIEDIGTVFIKHSQKASRISIKLKPFEGVQLILPQGADPQEGIRFVLQKKAWIVKHLQKMEAKEERLTVFDESTAFKARSFALKIQQHQRSDIRLQLNNGLLTIHYPQTVHVTHPRVQECIRHGIEEALRREAKSFLPGRLAWLARKWDISYRNVTIKNLKSRWGSCSAQNNINLNLHLMRLPDRLIDYVLLHELCHVHEKNHGPHFWKRLDMMTNGQARELDRAMRDYQTKIY